MRILILKNNQLYLFSSLSVNLLNAPKEVRAGTLRVVKHLITDEQSLQVLLDLRLDYFIARWVMNALVCTLANKTGRCIVKV